MIISRIEESLFKNVVAVVKVRKMVKESYNLYVLYSFSLNKPVGQKTDENIKIKHHKKLFKRNISEISNYFEDDKHGKIFLNSETITFTLQKIKI